jgi:PAS domain S-box-containing protein
MTEDTEGDPGGGERTKRRYQAVFNDPNILVAVLDPDGELLEVNETALEYVEASETAVVGTPLWETPWFDYSPALKDRVKGWIDRAADGEYVEFDAQLRSAGDDSYFIEGAVRPVTDDSGEVVSLIISDRDITETKRRERELERIQDFFREAERLGDLGGWELNPGDSLEWTEGTYRIHDVGEGEAPTVEEVLQFYHPEDRDTIRQAVEEAVSAGDNFEREARLIDADDNEKWVRTMGNVLDAEPDGSVRGFIQDITEQKERERELRSLKDQLESAIAAGAIGTWDWDVTTDTMQVGPAFARTFGIEPSAASDGLPLDRFLQAIHEDDRDRVEAAIDTAVENCGEYEAEYRVRDADGELRWVLAKGHVNCDDDGDPISFPGVLVDISARKEVERELEQRNERLEEFSSVLSHDLRNPLNVVAGRVELLQDQLDDEHLDRVADAVDRMDGMIDDLLELAQTDADITETEPVDVEQIARAAWETVETGAATLRTDLDRTVAADEGRLRQLFENLFRNAVEHAGEDVTVQVEEVPGGFAVEDDGAGIPAERREDVFESGVTESPDGTGLGLSIVAQIVSAHDWEIEITDGEVDR